MASIQTLLVVVLVALGIFVIVMTAARRYETKRIKECTLEVEGEFISFEEDFDNWAFGGGSPQYKVYIPTVKFKYNDKEYEGKPSGGSSSAAWKYAKVGDKVTVYINEKDPNNFKVKIPELTEEQKNIEMKLIRKAYILIMLAMIVLPMIVITLLEYMITH